MKLTSLLLTALLICIHTLGQSPTVTWSGNNVPVEKIFKVIKKQTGYSFFYNVGLLKDAHKISPNFKNAPLKEVLEKCFTGQPFDYVIENKTIVIN